MSGVVAVIRREYLQRVRSKWFVFATIAGPLFMLGLIVVPALIAARQGQTREALEVIDRTGRLYERLAPRLTDAGYVVTPAASDDVAAMDERVRSEEIGGYLLLDEGTLARGRAELRTGEAPSTIRLYGLRQAVTATALEARLAGATAGEVESLLAGGELETEVLAEHATRADDPAFIAAYVGAFILYMTILLYSMSIMRSVLEEKNSRVVEVILASMRPAELMLGKIIGVGAVGLTQLAIWVAAGVLIVGSGIPALIAARPELAELAELSGILPGVGYAALFLVFFFGGFFMYSGLYAAVGAMCNSDDEAQQAQWPVVMLLVVPVLFVTHVLQNPSAPLSVVLSLIPFFSPILMFARAATGTVPVWQILVSVVGMAAAVVAIAWVAGRIYKTGILMAGKRPTLPELVRWVREA